MRPKKSKSGHQKISGKWIGDQQPDSHPPSCLPLEGGGNFISDVLINYIWANDLLIRVLFIREIRYHSVNSCFFLKTVPYRYSGIGFGLLPAGKHPESACG